MNNMHYVNYVNGIIKLNSYTYDKNSVSKNSLF